MMQIITCKYCNDSSGAVYRQTDLFENDSNENNKPKEFTYFCVKCKKEFKIENYTNKKYQKIKKKPNKL